MPNIRVFFNNNIVLATEHRIDEIYTDNNRPLSYSSNNWFIIDSSLLTDDQGVIPFPSLIIPNPITPTLGVDGIKRDLIRQQEKDRTHGSGGRLDTLEQLLENDTISDSEIRELLRLRK